MARTNLVTAEPASPEQNSCKYCLSAHTAIGRKSGLDGAEIEANRSGMNILTNLLGKAGRVDIDFPKIELQLAA